MMLLRKHFLRVAISARPPLALRRSGPQRVVTCFSPMSRRASTSVASAASLNYDPHNLEQMAGVDMDDYGFSSSDEADLAAFIANTETSTAKRKAPGPPEPALKKLKQSTPQYPTTSPLARRILNETWGYNGFRLRQEEVISRLIHGGSAAVVFPTGGGKSLVYQVPALAFGEYEEEMGIANGPGLTVVVSPLIALMKDQVDALKARGVKAAAIDSTQSLDSLKKTYDLMSRGELKLLYCAPERLNNEGFVEKIKKIRIRLIAVDEAHCISEWGQAFRPDYLKVARFVKEVEAERVLCLTATATPRVAKDICVGFGIPEDGLFRTTTFRENLGLLAESFHTANDKMPRLKAFLKENPGASIVYITTQKQTEEVAAELEKDNIVALPYHAGLAPERKTAVQERFMKEKDITIVATIAFGMGIDKADIRNVVHYDFPRSLEGYSQEIGRAGRDDLPSKCLLFLCSEDLQLREVMCRTDLPSKNNVHGLLTEVFTNNAELKAGETYEVSQSTQSRVWDIRPNTLNLLYSQLELRFGLLRAITPKYSSYMFKLSTTFESTSSDPSPVAQAIRASYTGGLNKIVDIDSVSALAGSNRESAVTKLNEWHDKGFIELKATGVVQRYRMLKPFPREKAAVDKMIDLAYQQMEEREFDDLRRGKAVIGLTTSEGCFAAGLAAHFGDEVTGGVCGTCQYCISGRKVDMGGMERPLRGRIEEGKVKVVLEATKGRDDPRFLAKIAFGIGSPRITKEGCGKHQAFGSMKDCDFNALVEKFAGYCEKGVE